MQDELLGPIKIKDYRKKLSKKLKNDKFKITPAVYNSSVIQDFESFFRAEDDLVEDDIRLDSDGFFSNVITYEL